MASFLAWKIIVKDYLPPYHIWHDQEYETKEIAFQDAIQKGFDDGQFDCFLFYNNRPYAYIYHGECLNFQEFPTEN